nr:Uncharacterised protein [Klebsiella pneumoniae]
MHQSHFVNADILGLHLTGGIARRFAENNILLSGAGSTFYGCTSLVNIPPTLFASCSHITSFGATFQNTGVEEIPENLFSGNPLVTSYGQTFRGCKTCAQCLPVFCRQHKCHGIHECLFGM